VKVPPELADTLAFYLSRGYAGRVGFGVRPAVVVVDLCNAFTDPARPHGMDLSGPIEATVRVLDAGRAASIPIVFGSIAYPPDMKGAEPWIRKIPANASLVTGTPAVEIDARLGKRAGERLIVRAQASCFFGTGLADDLKAIGVDTVIVTGATTSGCVRATVVDACALGFRTIVVEDAVGDRAEIPHLVSLFDMDAKYADVADSSAVAAYLGELRSQPVGPA
jgi:nicotinamidase-related amidase